MGYLYLSFAIICEVAGTTALKASEGFTKVVPSTIVIVGYGVAFFLLSRVVKIMDLGVAYAIWAGVGIVLIAFLGWIVYDQKLDVVAIIGMVLIISGVVLINAFSGVKVH